jgi:hypothetical protein
MSYKEKYFKYKTKYLELQNQIGSSGNGTRQKNKFGDGQIPRYATLQFDSNELHNNYEFSLTGNYALSVRPFYIPSNEELLAQIEDNYKCVTSFSKEYYLSNLELFNTTYSNKIVFVYLNELTNIIPEGENFDKLQFILVVSDMNDINNVKELIKCVTESINNETSSDRKYSMLVSMLSGSYNLDTVKYINLMILLGILFTYWPIDIYGFICRQISMLNLFYARERQDDKIIKIPTWNEFREIFRIFCSDNRKILGPTKTKLKNAFMWYCQGFVFGNFAELGDKTFCV